MESKEQAAKEYADGFEHDDIVSNSLYVMAYQGFLAGASWQSSQPINSGWVEIDPSDINTIPDENVWTYWFKLDKVVFVPKGEFVPLGVVSHYMLLTKPSPPKQ
jgi:hypothetical protein